MKIIKAEARVSMHVFMQFCSHEIIPLSTCMIIKKSIRCLNADGITP